MPRSVMITGPFNAARLPAAASRANVRLVMEAIVLWSLAFRHCLNVATNMTLSARRKTVCLDWFVSRPLGLASLRPHLQCPAWATLADLLLNLPTMKSIRNAFLLLFFLAFFKAGLTVLALWAVFAILINFLTS